MKLIKSYLHYAPNCELKVRYQHYQNQRLAVVLVDSYTYEPVATATVNLPDTIMAAEHVAIKDWSENEGMLKTLQLAGLIGEVDHFQQSGYVLVGIYKWLDLEAFK